MTYKDLGVLIRNVGTYAQQAQKEAVFNATLYMKQMIEREVRGDLGGKDYFRAMAERKTKTGKFVGVRPANNRVGVRFDVIRCLYTNCFVDCLRSDGLVGIRCRQARHNRQTWRNQLCERAWG